MGRKKKQEDDDKASLIGRRVEKQFKGFGKFAGAVVAYNAARGFYKVVYDDGDREELELHEVNRILVDAVADVALPSRKRGRQAAKGEESCGHGQARKEVGSKRQKREPAGRQETSSSRSNFSPRNRSRPSTQRVTNDDGKEDSSAAEECKEDDDEDQLEINEQQSSFPSSKRKRQDEVEEYSERPYPAKFNHLSNHQDRIKSTRGQKILQNSDDEESTLDGDESSDYELGSSAEEDDDFLSFSSSDEDTLSMVHAKDSKELNLPALVPLPPSSRDIALSEDLVAEGFAVYSFLRSFSHVLFISPFCLDDFVNALIAEIPNSLTDYIHLILLQALRRHLQRLSKDGSRGAKECLRQRDWNLLDTITWPSFLMVFLVTHGFGKLYGQRIASLGLLDVEYYKAPVKTKLAVLGFLCDQVMETEEIRAVLYARELEFTSQVRQKDKKNLAGKVTDVPKTLQSLVTKECQEMAGDDALQRTRRSSTSFSVIETEFSREQSSLDWNSDECVLCGMNGNLICCDGCPAAYHSRCVGVSKASLPPGDWFCPECIVEKVGGEQSKRMDGLRGGHTLGIDPYGRTFISTCGHLLVLESSDLTQSSYKYYSKDDISGVLQSLEMLKPFCDKIVKSIRQHWDMPAKSSTVSDSSRSSPEDMGSLVIPSEVGLGGERHNYADVEESLVLQIKIETIGGEQKETESPALLPRRIVSESGKKPLETESLEGDSVLIPDHVDVKDSLVLPVVSESFIGLFNATNHALQCTPPQIVVSESDTKPTPGNTPNVVVFELDTKPLELDTKPLEEAPGNTPNFVVSNCDTKPLEAAPGTTPKPSEGAPGTTPNPFEGFTPQPLEGAPGTTPEPLEGIAPKPLEGAPGITANVVQNKQLNSQTIEYDPYLAQRIIDRDSKGRFLTAVSREHLHSDHFQKSGFYINHYVSGDAAATAAANLALMTAERTAPSEKGLKKKTGVTTIAEQLNAFHKAPARFCWPSVKKKLMEIPKERCGWCFSCCSSLKRGCLMNQVATHLAAGAAHVAGGIRPTKSGSGHLPAVAGYLLYMEDSVHSLLLGPWENLYFRKLWRKKVEQAVSICEVKAALLDLEAHLRSVVLAEDWSKCLEDAPSLVLGGSTTSLSNELFLRKAYSKKSIRRSGISRREHSKSHGSALGTVQWVRRGKVAHRVSGWAILSSKVARKSGRQGGLKRITGITYAEGEEVSKRSKQSAWRARVQAACTVAELAVQVRCLDVQFRWDDLVSKIEVHSAANKCEDNSMTEVEKSGIHAKSIKEEVPLYLIDSILISTQGLRQNVSPANQVMKDLTQNHKSQQVWVDERQVPLSLLREFEEKERLSSQSKAPKLAVLQKHHIDVKRIMKKDIFKFLWEKAGFSTATKLVMSITCKFCNLKVLASMAVQCHLCKGPFHKDCTVVSHSVGRQELKYTCYGCLKLAVGHKSSGLNVMKQQLSACSETPKNGKAQLALNMVPNNDLQPKKSAFSQHPKQQLTQSLISQSVKPPLSASSLGSQMKEGAVSLNQRGSQVLARSSNSVLRNLEKNSVSDGVSWRRNGMDSRMRFENNMLLPIQGNGQFSGSPECFICQQQYRMDLLYIKCEYCPLWFHGVAVGVSESNVSEVAGFKCHRCRKKAVPSCPYGTKHKLYKRNTQDSMSPYSAAMLGLEGRRPRVEEIHKTKRTPPPLLEGVENQPQHLASSAPCFTTAITSECATVKPLIENQLLMEGPAPVAIHGLQQSVQGSKDDSQTGFRKPHAQNEADCIIKEEVQEFSGGGEMTPLKEIVPGDSFRNGETLCKPTLSFMELLSSEDDRVEELAEFAMDFGVDGFDIFDVDMLMGSFGSGTSAQGSETVVLSEGGPCQILGDENQSVIRNINPISEEKSVPCAVCCDGSVSSDLQCIRCGIAVHQQCLAPPSAAETQTCHGWTCDACKAGSLLSQDILADRMQLIDSRILLQS